VDVSDWLQTSASNAQTAGTSASFLMGSDLANVIGESNELLVLFNKTDAFASLRSHFLGLLLWQISFVNDVNGEEGHLIIPLDPKFFSHPSGVFKSDALPVKQVDKDGSTKDISVKICYTTESYTDGVRSGLILPCIFIHFYFIVFEIAASPKLQFHSRSRRWQFHGFNDIDAFRRSQQRL